MRTSTGYKDYEIKPAIEIKIVDEDGVEKTMGDDELDINFSWAITEMTSRSISIQMDFEVPEALSSDSDGVDYLQVTFHGSDLIVGTNGLPIELGLTITKQIARQVNKEEAIHVSGTAALCSKILVCFIVITFVASLFMMADFTPFWSMFHTVQMIVHFPMFGMNVPGQLALFFAELIQVSKFNVFGINETILENWSKIGTVEMQQSDRSEDAVFAQMSYERFSMIPNLGVIYYLFWILTGLTVIGYLIDLAFKKTRKVDGGSMPLSKFGTNFLLRFFMAVYLEICICGMIQFQNMQYTGFAYSISSLSAIFFAILSNGAIAFVIFLMIKAPSERQAMEQLRDESDSIEIDVSETEQRIRGYKTLYLGLNLRHERRALYYPLMFFVRRLIFAALLVGLNRYPNIQIFSMMVVSTIVVCIFLSKKPYESPDNHWFEVANELLIFAATVMTLMYTPFITDIQARSKLGNAFIVLFGYVCILNSVFILTSLCRAAQLLMRKYSVDQEQLEAIKNGETPLPNMKKLKQAEGRLAAKEMEMSEIREDDADVSHREMQNALEDSGVKPMVTRSPVKQAKMRAEKAYDMQRSPSKGALVLPDVSLGDHRGRFSSQNILSSGGHESSFRPPSNEAELAAQLDDALNALDDLGDVPIPAAHAARDESAESELF